MSTATDKEKFITILQSHKGILVKIIRSYCRNKEDWKDLEQEIIIQLWKSIKTYDNTRTLSTWLYRVALNVAISHYRKERKHQHTSPLDESVFCLTADDTSGDELSEKTAQLYEFINSLHEFDRALIILYLEDYSHREIADTLGITESNVGTRLNRIRDKLRKSFTTAH